MKAIKPNNYDDLTQICWACGFPIIIGCNSKKVGRMATCQPRHGEHRPECTTARNAWRQKDYREKHVAAYIKTPDPLYQDNEAMRECLRCDPDENGVVPKFLSLSPGNRICEKCSNEQPGLRVSAHEIESYTGITRDFMEPLEAVRAYEFGVVKGDVPSTGMNLM